MEKKSFRDKAAGWVRHILEFLGDLVRKILKSLFPPEAAGMLDLGGEPGAQGLPEEERELSREELRQMSESPLERRRILFYGKVQGVGFRYQAMHKAGDLGLTGWVANRSDGSVEMEIQGPSDLIDHAIQAIGASRWIRVERMETKRIPPLPDERGFHVRGY